MYILGFLLIVYLNIDYLYIHMCVSYIFVNLYNFRFRLTDASLIWFQ